MASHVKYNWKRLMKVGPYTILNNDPHAITHERAQHNVPALLPILLDTWGLIEQATGYRWRCTSYVRRSPSHQKGHSLDLAPDMDEDLKSIYAHTRGSDPILHSRPALIRKLLRLRDVRVSPDADVIIAAESDHLHLQVVPRGKYGPHPMHIVRWQTLKPVYSDTALRNAITAPLRNAPVGM